MRGRGAGDHLGRTDCHDVAAAGTSLDNVLTATTHLTRVQDVAAYNEEYGKYFPTDKPARTTVTVAALNAPELLIEITVTACIPD